MSDDFERVGKKIPEIEMKKLYHQLMRKAEGKFFSDRQDVWLISCKLMPDEVFANFDLVPIYNREEVIIFFENYHIMMKSSWGKAIAFLKEREPWEDFDVCIFDESMDWCVALTHNDEIKAVKLDR